MKVIEISDGRNNWIRQPAHHSIIIGQGLTSHQPYQLLVETKNVKINKIMTPEEYDLVSSVMRAIDDMNNN